jgi:hypothetical protein
MYLPPEFFILILPPWWVVPEVILMEVEWPVVEGVGAAAVVPE